MDDPFFIKCINLNADNFSTLKKFDNLIENFWCIKLTLFL